VPVISIAILASAVLTYFLGDSYSVRLITAKDHALVIAKAQADPKASEYKLAAYKPRGPLNVRLKLHDAVQLWKDANNCGGRGRGATCPRPIIIAASAAVAITTPCCVTISRPLASTGKCSDRSGKRRSDLSRHSRAPAMR